MRFILNDSQISFGLWHEAVGCVNITKQREPYNFLRTHQIPHKLWHGHKPSVARLHVFGDVSTFHVTNQQRQQKSASKSCWEDLWAMDGTRKATTFG